MNNAMGKPEMAIVRKSAFAPRVAKNTSISAPLIFCAPAKLKILHKFSGTLSLSFDMPRATRATHGAKMHAKPRLRFGCPTNVANICDPRSTIRDVAIAHAIDAFVD